MSYYYSNNGGMGRGGFLSSAPPVTKNLIIINIIIFLATYVGERVLKTNVMSWLVLYDPRSYMFRWWQPLTYAFMHGGFWHILFNMYTLYIFGSVVERMIGSRKFGVLYTICALGAAACHSSVMIALHGAANPMLGASGAVYGVVIAYAMLFPTSQITLLFPPVTLSAKWMVLIFLGIEMLTGLSGTIEGVAHFAHLGGMLLGWLLILYWKRNGKLFDRDNF